MRSFSLIFVFTMIFREKALKVISKMSSEFTEKVEVHKLTC